MHVEEHVDERASAVLALNGEAQQATRATARSIVELFAAQVRETPDAVAVVFDDAALTYHALDDRANRLAHRLRSLGVGPGTLVGLCVERSLEMAVGVLGILQAGGAYVPLDPTLPQERLAFMMEDAALSVVLAHRALAAKLPAHGGECILLDADLDQGAATCEGRPAPEVRGDDPIYVLYTSGSTGRPKGVAMRNAALHNLITWHCRDPRLGQPARTLQFAALGFDVSAQEMLGTWATGGMLVLVSDETRRDAAALLALIDEHAIERIFLPFVFLQHLAEAACARDRVPASLRDIITAGEQLRITSEIRWLMNRLSGAALHNHYGPTETHVVTSHVLEGPADAWPPLPPIGKPIANTQMHVLDEQLAPVPVGEPGELYIGGAGLARGYIGRPDLTAERFLPDPFSAEPDARIYKTGDLCRWLPDGALAFLGRIDHQVKIRGFRVELGEIEHVLGQHPATRAVAVIACEVASGETRRDMRLVAHLVAHEGAAVPNASELRGHAQAVLPEYMVPSAFVWLPALPLLPSGKVDRSALAAQAASGHERPEEAHDLVAPRTATERLLAGIWSEVLGIDDIGVDENFFELGGHSLLGAQVLAKLLAAVGVDFPLRTLFEAPTVAALAVRVDAAGQADAPAAAPLVPIARQVTLPLSFAQERLWFLHQLAPQSSAYNYPAFFHLQGALDTAALERSLRELVRRHESLRTTFSEADGRPVQVIAADLPLRLDIVDLRRLSAEERGREAQRRIDAEAQQPFDLCRGPLVRASLLVLADDEHIFMFDVHHIATDGWSMSVLYQELGALYDAFARGQPAALAAPPIQYADYAQWQRRALEQGALEQELAWWQEQLAGVPFVLDLPADRPRPAQQDFRGGTVVFRIDAACTQRLRGLAATQGVSPAMILLAAFSTLLHRYTGEEEFLLGAPHANRDRAELERVVGFFVNTLVLRCSFTGDPTFGEVLARVRETNLRAHEHAALPFERLVQALQPERDPSRNPLVQVLCASQIDEMGRPALLAHALPFEQAKSSFDLTFFFREQTESIAGTLEYSTALFERSTIERMAEHLRVLVDMAVSRPDLRVSSLAFLPAAERRQVVVDWNQTAAEYPDQACIHHLVAAQVARTPEAVAVRDGSRLLTYRALDQRANQLARRLIALGVGTDALVGICTGRCMEMVIAALAVLKAGGAYVPLDPLQPDQRLHFMLSDTRAVAVLTLSSLAHRLSAAKAPVLALDTDWPEIAGESDAAIESVAGPGDLAYVIYTSGSTGKPKGVQVEHRSLVNLAMWHVRAFAVSHVDRAILLASPGFDASVWETWPYLCAGACLDIPDENVRYAPAELARWLIARGVTICFAPTTVAEQLLQHPWPAHTSLRCLLTGGDRLRSWPRADLPFEVVNNYGPTEGTVVSTSCSLGWNPAGQGAKSPEPPIGRPIANTRVYILDAHGNPVPIGVPGELFIGGAGIARGYLNRHELTSSCFVADAFSSEPGARSYRTGDRGRWRADGTIEFLARTDHQVKIRGFRVELGEVEAALRGHPDVRDAVVTVREDAPGEARMVAYLVARSRPPHASALRDFLQQLLPDYMIPAVFVVLDALPVNASGKVDRAALPHPREVTPVPVAGSAAPGREPGTAMEEALAAIWREVLGLERVGMTDRFFDIGGHSMLLAQVRARVRERLDVDVDMVELFRLPTIPRLAQHLAERLVERLPGDAGDAGHANDQPAEPQVTVTAIHEITESAEAHSGSIAIIGMAGRFPGAADVDALWALLRDGREGLARFTVEALEAAGVAPDVLRWPGLVPVVGLVDDALQFDAGFFGYSNQDARLLDPQHRLFLECAWAALEDAGYDPTGCELPVGVFGGSGTPRYWLQRLARETTLPGTAEEFRVILGNSRDFLATRVAYKLGLHGPALNVQSACSTSLVAVHLACQSLLAGQCDMALAGGVSVFSPGPAGYVHEQGGILSADGHCRPFDAQADGTVPASGVGIVCLKRIEDALADGDAIRAVIRGSAINNDGLRKVGYTAPSVDGQADVIARAHAAAGVDPDTITYVEAHGTGTSLGDPIEVAALTQAFRARTSKTGYCALGSLKSNLGHLDAAAGVAGLIKAVLALQHERIPATLHFQAPNPALALERSPFFVADRAIAWKRTHAPRRAGVSSFGLGGTNAHAVLEEAPERPASGAARPWQLLALSARTEAARERMTGRLADHLAHAPHAALADTAFTLHVGRAAFAHRRAVVCRDVAEARSALAERDRARVCENVAHERPRVVFMFPGGGTQQVGMGRELYVHEPVYREALDRCAAFFGVELGYDIRHALFPADARDEAAAARLLQPSLNTATIFATEYALAQLLLSWGITPAAVTGHSVGEYSAACLAGMLSLEDAIALIAFRGRLQDELPASAGLIVGLSERALAGWMAEGLSIAAVNGPEHCVVSGALAAIEKLEADLQAAGVHVRRLQIATAPHSSLVEPAMDRIRRRAASIKQEIPRIPIISNVTGTWMSQADALDPGYWARHLRQTVRFADGVATLLADGDAILLEVGPGKTLSTLARAQASAGPDRLVLTTMSYSGSSRTDMEALLHALGQLWCAGLDVDWAAFYRHERRQRVPLPSYPFERATHVIGPSPAPAHHVPPPAPAAVSTPAPVLSLAPALAPMPVAVPAHVSIARQGAAVAPHRASAPLAGNHGHGDAIEPLLAEIWRELLGVETVRPSDNFFDLGGNSLMAVQLRSRVRAQLGVQLSVHALVESPTFGALLEAARAAGAVAPAMPLVAAGNAGYAAYHEDAMQPPEASMNSRLLVRLQSGSPARPPMFFIQPIGGTAYTYLELAQHLGGGWPVYAFRALGLEPGERIHSDMASMAERNLQELLELFPEGPYFLGGYSAGGALAYEMACQLTESGHEVGLVWLGDSGPSDQYRRLDIAQPENWLRAVDGFKDLAPQAWHSLRTAFAEDSSFREIIINTYKALAAFEPRRLRARVLYIRAEERDSVLDHHPETWWMDRVDGRFIVESSPGNHLTMLDPPHVETMARILRRHLTALEASGLSPAPVERALVPGPVASGPVAPAASRGRSGPLSVVSPSGLRLEGAAIEDAIQMFQLLGGLSNGETGECP